MQLLQEREMQLEQVEKLVAEHGGVGVAPPDIQTDLQSLRCRVLCRVSVLCELVQVFSEDVAEGQAGC